VSGDPAAATRRRAWGHGHRPVIPPFRGRRGPLPPPRAVEALAGKGVVRDLTG